MVLNLGGVLPISEFNSRLIFSGNTGRIGCAQADRLINVKTDEGTRRFFFYVRPQGATCVRHTPAFCRIASRPFIKLSDLILSKE